MCQVEKEAVSENKEARAPVRIKEFGNNLIIAIIIELWLCLA